MEESIFYSNDKTENIAKKLLGMTLTYKSAQGLVGGIIVETEAYLGHKDSAAHVYNGKRTPSNEPLYSNPGAIYIYSIHGRYLLDIVTQAKETPEGILIRAIEPTIGKDIMEQNRLKHGYDLTNGPGKLMEALNIQDKKMNYQIINSGNLCINSDNHLPAKIDESSRIGVSDKGDWTNAKLRFSVNGNPYVSNMKKSLIDNENYGWIK
ncbi:DNA-3-methyladenine glycosylase [Lactobacillus sp. S2-2]|uniref:DNA-3-methyladenine glycosylase n=1 Tax=Lactobacillus sp. S2-2 TaxID=2692917 RepID=UPI001F39D259|nr:DNA-3-methyladenine glycosylase [Lactobacillus sp. S2-2]MCF6515455.1 DNA-3-methyladenine glycosylase [Lactobacillus sp. S2-2]